MKTVDNFTTLFTKHYKQKTLHNLTQSYTTLQHQHEALHNCTKLDKRNTKLLPNFTNLYKTLHNFTNLFNTLQNCTNNYNTFFFGKLYKTWQNKATSMYTILRSFSQVLHKCTRVYTSFTTLQKKKHFTQLYKTVHNTTTLYTILHNYTQLYMTKPYTTCPYSTTDMHFLQNSRKLYTTLRNFRKYKIVQKHGTQLKDNKALQHFTKRNRNLTKLYNSIENLTQF